MNEKRIAMIGLDTSHTAVFTKLMQSPNDEERVVEGMRAVTALRFPSAFQPEAGQDERQAEMESMGVVIKETLEEAIADVDAIFLEINDPALHLEYFEAVAGAGLPVFIDKPLASSTEEGRRIQELAEKHQLPVWSASSLRFIPALADAIQAVSDPIVVHTFGALGEAATGSDLIWYGVHAVEMLLTAFGTGAAKVRALQNRRGVILSVEYPDDRQGLVECLRGLYAYGGRIQSKDKMAFFDSGSGSPYAALMTALRGFVCDGKAPVPLGEAQEVLAILEAGERSLATGKSESVDV